MTAWPADLISNAIHARILRALDEIGLAPKRCEIAGADRFWAVNYVDRDASEEMIAAGACSGFSNRLATARAKALSEWVERLAMKRAYRENPTRFAKGSDGCAAFPIVFSRRRAVSKARNNALQEAIERYAWARWWDDKRFAHKMRLLERKEIDPYWNEINKFAKIESITCVNPIIKTSKNYPPTTLEILVARTREGGILTGGSASSESTMKERRERALSELLRHAIAYSRRSHVAPNSLYEQRLVFFGSGAGTELVENRLAATGLNAIELPGLAFDSEVEHALKELVVVYHCLFAGQPDFIGGPVERLCV